MGPLLVTIQGCAVSRTASIPAFVRRVVAAMHAPGVRRLVLPGLLVSFVTASAAGPTADAGFRSASVNHTDASADLLQMSESLVTVSSSLNPSLSTRPPLLIAVVSVAGGVTPTGSVEFFDGAASLGVTSVRFADGQFSAAIGGAALTVGDSPHMITARYSGDGDVLGSVSNAVAQVVKLGTYQVTEIGSGSNGVSVARLNGAGQVIGNGNIFSVSDTRPFLWTEAGGFVDVGTLGGSYSVARALNATGMVAGYSAMAGDGDIHPFAWTSAGGIVDLGTLGGDGFSSNAVAVNDNGMVAGDAALPDSSLHAFAWTHADQMIDIGTLGGTNSFAHGLNNTGTVVGESNMAGDTSSHAFVWTRAAGIVDLGTLGGTDSFAYAVNDEGTVIGSSRTAGDAESHAFAWTPAGGILDLGTLGGTFSHAIAVNNNGLVIGASAAPGATTTDAETHAFVWTRTTGIVDLGTLGGTSSVAFAVNDQGVVVGYSNVSGDAEAHAFMWTQATGMVDVGRPGDGDSSVIAVNASGQLLGSTPTHGFLLTPVAVDTRTKPTITWTDPADIVFGTSLDDTQLNATTDVPGTFEYVPAAGTILNAGGDQPLTATFSPTDADTYAPVSATVHINVRKATPTIAWSRPAPIVYGTPLGAAQLNAAANVPGTFVYTPGAGTILPVGAARPLTALFTPADSVNDTIAAATVTVDVTSVGPPVQPPFQVLHAFTYTDGAIPVSALIQASDNLFYGTTSSYGPSGYGTVFRMTAAGSVTTLHAFTNADGASPSAGLIQASDGSFYGTTSYGGQNGYGTIYRIDLSGTLTTLHAFSYADGSYPLAGVIQAHDGFFYGTTPSGGVNGVGTVYRIDAAGTMTTLHSFTYSDGAYPYAGLVQARDGFIYGVTSFGGPSGAGTVFRLNEEGTPITLHAFAYGEGSSPSAALVQASDGFLYGTTPAGGPTGAGTVFRVDTAGALTTLHTFAYADGAYPRTALIQASDGFFYGTTSAGSGLGTVYRMDAAGTVQTLHVFTGPDGSAPNGSLIQGRDGFLYGTAQFGGSPQGGTVFRLALRPLRPVVSASQLAVSPVSVSYGGFAFLSATLTSSTVPIAGRLVSFALNGAAIGGATSDANGFANFGFVSLAGINAGTYVGGVRASFAGDASYLPSAATSDLVVFKQTPFVTWAAPSPIVYGTALGAAQLSATANVPGMLTFTPPPGTILPVGAHQTLSVVFTPSDLVNYTVVATGVTIDVSSAHETQATLEGLHAFTGPDGASPYAGLIQANDGLFYGTTAYGGASGYGSVYRMDTSGAVTTLHEFAGEDGAYPYGGLIQAGDGFFYGTTAFGGASGFGTVYRMDGSGVVTTQHAFSDTEGASPYAGVMQASDGFLYGTTSEGGPTGYGTVYRIDATGVVTTLHAFTHTDGAYPYAALMQGNDGAFYGTTLQGGPGNYGVAYRMDAAGTTTPLHAFTWTDGAYPYAGVLQASDGSLYGTASYGGPSGAGTAFRIDAAGNTTPLHTFTSGDGAYPYSRLIQRSDGFFYGATSQGGSGGGGTLYRIDAGSAATTLHAFRWIDGSSPYAALVEGHDGFLYGTTPDGGPHNVGTIFRLLLRATSQLAASPAPGVYGATTVLSATLTSAGALVAGAEVSFTLNGSPAGHAITDANGVAAIAGVSVAGISPGTYPGAIGATFAGDGSHAPSSGAADLIVAKLTPMVTWSTPAAIGYGTPLDATQLKATADVEGTFLYTPAAGAILPVGAGQMLSVLFMPLDAAIYASQVAHVTIDVISTAPPTVASFQVLHSFNSLNSLDGSSPYATLTLASDGLFYGTTYRGGSSGNGTVFQMDAVGNLATLHSFDGTDGASPYGGVIRAGDGSFYGTTSSSGPGGYGTVYRLDATGLATLGAFNYANGVAPSATLLQAMDGSFYGTTYYGGPSGYGTVFRVDAAGVVTTLHAFTYSEGGYPFGGLIQARGGLFYGTTSYAGPGGYGTVYRMDADGNVTTLHAFGNADDGANPYEGVIQGSDGSFYGTTYAGGPGGYGTVYRMTAAGSVTTLHGFNFTDGASPYGTPIQGRDGYFYGTTISGGANSVGTVYRIDGAGRIETLHAFTYDAYYPYAGLVQASDGSLYGTTIYGGSGVGTVYRLTLRATNQLVVSPASGGYGATLTLSATMTLGGSPLAGREVTFALNGFAAGTATTNDSGVATIAGVSLAGINASTYPGGVQASFAGDSSYAPSSGTADLIVAKAIPTITWSQPSSITYGTPLDGTQLNATANVPGNLVYSPSPGTILALGAAQTLSVAFTPFDTVNYTDAAATVTIEVVAATPFFPTSDFGTFSVGQLELPLTATGGDGLYYAWSVAAGSLPSGLSIRTDVPEWFPANARAGLIGVATTPGTYDFTLSVTSAGQTFEGHCTLRISALLVSENYQLPDAFAGESYSYTFSATGNANPVVWTSTFGLPPGMTLDSAGVLSGTPATLGYYFVNFSASDGVATVYRGVSLYVSAIDITTSGVLPNATQFGAYSASVTATGGSGVYTFRIDSLPPGLVSDTSGSISGAVTAEPGKWGLTVTATDSNGASYTKTMSIDIIGAPLALPRIIPFGDRFDDCTIGVPCQVGIGVYSGGTAPFTWSANGLPAGMWIRSGSGNTPSYFIPGDAQIAGAPATAGTYAVQVSVTDALGASATNTFPLHVSTLLETEYLPNGNIGAPYAAALRVIGGSGSYTVAQVGGHLPAGVTYDGASLQVSGTPIENGAFSVVWEFTDSAGETLQTTRYPYINGGVPNIAINGSSNLGTIVLGSFYSNQLFACCASSLAWSVTGGALPPGVNLSTTGQLSGTPTTIGSYTFLVQATDTASSANFGLRQFTLVITPLSVTTSFTLPDGFVTTPYSAALTATGGSGALTWTLAPWNYLPPGLTLAADGTLAGTPSASGQFSFTVTVADADSHVLARTFRMFVYPEGGHPPLNLSAPAFINLNPGAVFMPLSASGDALGGAFGRSITINVSALQVVSLTSPPNGTVNKQRGSEAW
jgi:uncharacterized repeat protein (TIGR03803 family)/probable HAF family extracellular repeat protein